MAISKILSGVLLRSGMQLRLFNERTTYIQREQIIFPPEDIVLQRSTQLIKLTNKYLVPLDIWWYQMLSWGPARSAHCYIADISGNSAKTHVAPVLGHCNSKYLCPVQCIESACLHATPETVMQSMYLRRKCSKCCSEAYCSDCCKASGRSLLHFMRSAPPIAAQL